MTFYINIEQYRNEIFRSKIDIIKILLIIFSSGFVDRQKKEGDMTVEIFCDDTSNRIIMYKTLDHIQTMYSPFILKKEEYEYSIHLDNALFSKKIDAGDISFLKAFFNTVNDRDSDYAAFYCNFIDLCNEYNFNDSINQYWNLIFYLLDYDTCYFRFDNDSRNEKLINHRIHPRYHLDTSFCPMASYKIGLYKELYIDEIKDFVDKTTDSFYIEKESLNDD